MASTPTERNRLNKQGTGDNAGAWGGVLNDQALELIDEALDGVVAITVSGNVTLSSTNYVSNEARNRVLKFAGAGGFIVQIPGVEKFYVARNGCTAAVTIKTAAGVGVSIAPSATTFLFCDGTDCFAATNMWPIASGTASAPGFYFTSDTQSGLYLPSAGTLGLATGGAGRLQLSSTGAAVTGAISTTGHVTCAHGGNTSIAGVAGAAFDASGYVVAERSGGTALYLNRYTSTGSLAEFYSAGVGVGSISVSGAGTTYATSSDYRLKGGITDLTGAVEFVRALRPRQWKWLADGSDGAGFVAHELQEVSSTSVVGDKDAVDEDGRLKPQGAQPGSPEVIANLVAVTQLLLDRLDALEAA